MPPQAAGPRGALPHPGARLQRAPAAPGVRRRAGRVRGARQGGQGGAGAGGRGEHARLQGVRGQGGRQEGLEGAVVVEECDTVMMQRYCDTRLCCPCDTGQAMSRESVIPLYNHPVGCRNAVRRLARHHVPGLGPAGAAARRRARLGGRRARGHGSHLAP